MITNDWPKTRTGRIVVLLDKAKITEIDKIGKASGFSSRSATIRNLIDVAIEEKGPVETAISPSHEHTQPHKGMSNEQS